MSHKYLSMNNKIWSQLEILEQKLQSSAPSDPPLLVYWDGEFLRAHSLTSRRGMQLLQTMGSRVVGIFDRRISPLELREATLFVLAQYPLEI